MSLSNLSATSCPDVISPESSSLPTSQADQSEVNDDFRWARFFRELAGILVLYMNIPGQAWMNLLKTVGASQNDVDDVISQDLDPEIQVYKLLNKSKSSHTNTQDWWRVFSRETTKVGNDNLSKDLQKAYEKFITDEIVDSLSFGKSLPHVGGTPPGSPSPTPPPCIPLHSQSFELINEEDVIRSSEAIKSKLKEEIDVEISDPEVSQQIDNVRRAIQDIAGRTQQHQLALQLAEAAAQILKMENSYRATQTLKDILEHENEISKKEKARLIQENEAQSQEIQHLKQEMEDRKKTSADKNLSDFDVITKREAHELAVTKKSVPLATAATTDDSNTVNISAYNDLQARCIKVTKQRDQLVKINHQWDQEYHNMEKALRSDNQKIYQDVVAKDDEIMAGKRLIASLEKEKSVPVNQLTQVLQEKSSLEKTLENEKSKRKKYHEYATRLNQQKDKLQREITRLNQVLSQEKKKRGKSGPAAAVKDDVTEEMALYRQQAEYFEKDFHEEQREKRRLVGELEASKQELLTVKRKLKKMNDKVQMAQDEQFAQLLQAGRNKEENVYFEAGGRGQQEPVPRGLNYAGNDRFVDAGLLSSFGSIEADGVDGTQTPVDKDGNVCPRCEAFIADEQIFVQHLERCLNED